VITWGPAAGKGLWREPTLAGQDPTCPLRHAATSPVTSATAVRKPHCLLARRSSTERSPLLGRSGRRDTLAQRTSFRSSFGCSAVCWAQMSSAPTSTVPPVLNGRKPASDVEVLVVSRGGMDQQERLALLDGLLAVSSSRNEACPVELTAVVQSQVRRGGIDRSVTSFTASGCVPTTGAERFPGGGADADLALLITMAGASDHPLTGPRPAQVLDAVPRNVCSRSLASGPRSPPDRSGRRMPQPIGSSPSFHPSAAPPPRERHAPSSQLRLLRGDLERRIEGPSASVCGSRACRDRAVGRL
jgi:hypothetical protein